MTFDILDTGAKTIETKTKPSDFPSALRQKLQSNVQAVERHKLETSARVNEKCMQCGREEVTFTNVQLRGADEGSTLIFRCECGHSYVARQDACISFSNPSNFKSQVAREQLNVHKRNQTPFLYILYSMLFDFMQMRRPLRESRRTQPVRPFRTPPCLTQR